MEVSNKESKKWVLDYCADGATVFLFFFSLAGRDFHGGSRKRNQLTSKEGSIFYFPECCVMSVFSRLGALVVFYRLIWNHV